jgi:hypothetical protein
VLVIAAMLLVANLTAFVPASIVRRTKPAVALRAV